MRALPLSGLGNIGDKLREKKISFKACGDGFNTYLNYPSSATGGAALLEIRVEEGAISAQNRVMAKRYVIAKLRDHESELRAAGIVHLRVFGSVARDESSFNSDIDLLADFDKSKRLTLVTVGNLQSRLSKMLGAKVDLSSAD
jgi:uncharacterized protein